MSLFQKSVEKKYLNELDKVLLDKKYVDFQNYFGNSSIQENIRKLKEEEFQGGFINALFVKIFDYTLKPEPNFNIVLEKKNVDDSKKADAAILDGDEVIAVIELKGTDTTDLDKIEIQAFGYKNHNSKCAYVITSNFEKLRFYIQNAIDHIDFDLFNMTRDQFAIMWLCLAKENLLNGIPLKIKDLSVIQEEDISKKLYADYSKFREAIYNNLVINNPEIDKLILFKKTQKLLDRFLFIFFAEDRQLVPANSITQIVEKWKYDNDFGDKKPLLNIFKQYFNFLNTGRPKSGNREEIFAYNGGLFAPDEILDTISIDDNILFEHTNKLSQYDYETEVDVNILGHIFEHSLGEIESVQAEIKGENIDTQKAKRKKDGIFYTPKYITKYIVENTVGKLCEEKRSELQIVDEEYSLDRKAHKKEIIKKLDDKLTNYRNWLLGLTILDPACGSGAFLNQALDFLIEEHKKIDNLRAQLFGAGFVFSDITTDILEKNIYGVDINEESVEIAKLSLWLRTAQKGRKLNKLNNNIKCGNSLIDDPEIAGDKAFNWQNEFPEIFAKGGFDVVIGNPPYGAKIDKSQINFIAKKFDNSLSGEVDTYIVFYFISINLLKHNGFLGFITPDTWLTIVRANGLRKFLYNNCQLINVHDRYKPFQDAKDTRCHTVILRKIIITNYSSLIIVVDSSKNIIKSYDIQSEEVLKDFSIWNLYSSPQESRIFNKMESKSHNLHEFYNLKYGLRTGDNSKYLTYKENKIKIARGSNIQRYYFNWTPEYLNTTEGLPEFYFENSILSSPKLIIQYVRTNSTDINSRWLEAALIDEANFVPLNSTSFFYLKNSKYSLKYLLTILSSYLMNYYYKAHYTDVNVKPLYLSKLPIPDVDSIQQQPFIEKADLMLSLNKELQEATQKFQRTIQRNFEIEELSTKLQNWYTNTYKEFLAELGKKKIKLTLAEESEWEEYFLQEQTKTMAIKRQIDATDKEIDQLVNELYGLTEEEIKIVEESMK